MKHWWAIRPVNSELHDHYTRMVKASTPAVACRLTFGRGLQGFEYKDLGTRVQPLRSDRQRIALLTSAEGWTRF